MRANREISVTVSAEQARLFEELAQTASATAGEVLLGLACERLAGNPFCGEQASDIELMSLCWLYSKTGKVPDAGQWLTKEQWKKLGYDGPAVELAT